MGSKHSSVYSEHPTLTNWKKLFDVLSLSDSDIGHLYHEFLCLSMDEYQMIDVKQLVVAMDVRDDLFAHIVFGSMDSSATEKVNFGDYVAILWNFCTLQKRELGKASNI